MTFYKEAFEAALEIAKTLATEMIREGHFAQIHREPGEFTFRFTRKPDGGIGGFMVLTEKFFGDKLRVFPIDEAGYPIGKGRRLVLSRAKRTFRAFLT